MSEIPSNIHETSNIPINEDNNNNSLEKLKDTDSDKKTTTDIIPTITNTTTTNCSNNLSAPSLLSFPFPVSQGLDL